MPTSSKQTRQSFIKKFHPSRFSSEKALVAAYLRSIRHTDSLRIAHKELESANGIADVVRVRLRKDWKRWAQLGRIPPQWAFALHELPYKKRFTAGYFAQITGATERTARAVLKVYEKHGFCKEFESKWIKQKQPRPIASEIVAIEAKLSDWRRALDQAYRYQDYATTSWVLLDGRNANGAISNLEAFRRLNVGLAIMSPGQKPRRIFTPEKQKPKSPIRYWHALAAIGRLAL